MSVCSCAWETDLVLGSCLMGPRTARTIPKSGNTCPVCGEPVDIGETVIDFAGLWAEDLEGWFSRMHAACFDLMERFAAKVCGREQYWSLPFNLEESARHAVAHGDEPFWRDWLECYALTWHRYQDRTGGDDE